MTHTFTLPVLTPLQLPLGVHPRLVDVLRRRPLVDVHPRQAAHVRRVPRVVLGARVHHPLQQVVVAHCLGEVLRVAESVQQHVHVDVELQRWRARQGGGQGREEEEVAVV